MPVLIPAALIAALFDKGRACTPQAFAAELTRLTEGDGPNWDQLWDRVECVRIRDPRLEEIRQEAVKFGPPCRDVEVSRAAWAALAARAARLSP
jgi:hypothetical protein